MTEPLLKLSSYGVAFGHRIILSNINLSISPRGMVVLAGPSGTGKSTLLRTLTGLNDASPMLRTEGEAWFQGLPLGQGERPAIVVQKTRLMMSTLRENIVNKIPGRQSLQLAQQRELVVHMLISAGLDHLINSLERCVVELSLGEQRLVALLRTAAANPGLIFVDEPTAGVSDKDAELLLAHLSRESELRAIVTVLHNQRHALKLGGTTVLMAGGTVVESQSTAEFFSLPRTALGREFVRTGSCCAASPGAAAQDLDECFVVDRNGPSGRETETPLPSADRHFRSDAFGPRNFLWLQKGCMAGMPRPGLFLDVTLDLAALQRVGITALVCLESEVEPTPPELLQQFGIRAFHLPIPDMCAPDLDEAIRLFRELDALHTEGGAVVMHCKAGMGRTGTMLVAWLIWRGRSALNALETARKIEPRWVQSQEQVNFLERFEGYLSGRQENDKPEGLLLSDNKQERNLLERN